MDEQMLEVIPVETAAQAVKLTADLNPNSISPLQTAYGVLFGAVLVILAVFLLCCLIRAIRGPRIADRVIAINMMGTLIVVMICALSFIMDEGYLVDVAMIYTMLSFLAVVLLTKIYMGAHREKMRNKQKEENADA